MDRSGIYFFIIVAIAIFFILREFFTWYWKQNEIVKLLKSIDAHLEKFTASLPDDDEEETETRLFMGKEDVTEMIKR